MQPDLLTLGPLTIHSYGFLIVIGFLFGLGLIKIRAPKFNIKAEKAIDLAFGLLLGGFLGAKLFHWIIIPSGLIADMQLLFSEPVSFIKNLGNGFEFFGGIVFGVIYFVWYTKRHHMPRLATLDLITPSIPLAHAFGRLGCFMAGCCYGKPCDHAWAVSFNHPHTLAPRGINLHPTQLYESLLLVSLVGVLLYLERITSNRSGRLVSFYILGYTIIRFFVEYFRGDDRGILPGINLSGTQIIAMFIAMGAMLWLWFLRKQSPGENESVISE